jgi:hypothetical protein
MSAGSRNLYAIAKELSVLSGVPMPVAEGIGDIGKDPKVLAKLQDVVKWSKEAVKAYEEKDIKGTYLYLSSLAQMLGAVCRHEESGKGREACRMLSDFFMDEASEL